MDTEIQAKSTPPAMNSVSNGWHSNGQTSVVQPLLTDLYQITMTYALWKAGKANQPAAFDLFFRKNPFGGEFTIFCGLEECLKFLENFSYSESDISYLRSVLPAETDAEFFHFLAGVSPRALRVYAVPEGSVVFPRVPLIRVEGPLGVAQLLETTLLTLVNYSSLVATNAARFRVAAGDRSLLMEFGLRRAQGPDGGLSASKYCYIGGFDGTSNVLAGKLYGIPVRGTHAHAFVSSFTSLHDLTPRNRMLSPRDASPGSEQVDFCALCVETRRRLCDPEVTAGVTTTGVTTTGVTATGVIPTGVIPGVMIGEVRDGELAAFISYATAFPNAFLALVDTYNVLRSGLANFCAVAVALHQLGYRALGIRLDSGDLAYLSTRARRMFTTVSQLLNIPWFKDLHIVASNDINEETLYSLNEQGHEITSYGIGTHLVTCQRQPALGCVYKLVELCGAAKMKLSEDVEKVTLPGRKLAYRLYNGDGAALVDVMARVGEREVAAGEKVYCRHPFSESKRAYVTPARIEKLHQLYWDGGQIVATPLPSLEDIKRNVQKSLQSLRSDIKRNLNPTPYKVSVSDELYTFLHKLWLDSAPIGELS